MKYKHKNGKIYELKKEYDDIVTCYLLDDKGEKIPELDKRGRQNYNMKGEKMYEKRILEKKDLKIIGK